MFPEIDTVHLQHSRAPFSQGLQTQMMQVASSTSGYISEMGCLQWRHFPARMSQERTGMLSYHASFVSHFGHRDGGDTSDSSRGSRHTTRPTSSSARRRSHSAAVGR